MHISDKPQVLLVSRGLTYCTSPFLYSFQDLGLHSGRPNWWSLRETPYQFVEKFLCADLEMKWISAVLHTYIQEIEREQRDVGIAVVDVVDDCHGCFAGRIALLRVDKIGNF